MNGMNGRKRRSGLQIMGGLLGLLRPMLPVMAACVTLGTLGAFSASFITILAANLLLTAAGLSPWRLGFGGGAALMLVLAAARAGLRYSEQTCGHYIAFKLLAVIRDRVFAALRRLAPARLQGKGRGDLIALVTGDIELLEVFYAHTIAPVCIAALVSGIMSLGIGRFHPLLGCFALLSYVLVGAVVPLASSKRGREAGMTARNELGALNSVFLESLRGLREVRQFAQEENRAAQIREKTERINEVQGAIKRHEGAAAACSGALVMLLPLGMLALGLALRVPFPSLVLSTVSLASSFGPALALSNLSAAMDQTLAAGDRVLSLLDETPETPDIEQGAEPDFTGAAVRDLHFSYGDGEVLRGLSADFPKGEIIAVTGRSGSGKSTLLRLLMRFWAADAGSVLVSGLDAGAIRTEHLRALEGFMTQDTDLFHISVRDNIRLGRPEATDAEVEAAARKASVHDFIESLPKGYDTLVGELGGTLSGGEKQRLGLARAFLYGAPLLLLDEPTSNLDSLNEGVILRALREERGGRTVVLVSHRPSTAAIADRRYDLAEN